MIDRADVLVLRACLETEIEATVLDLRNRPPDPLFGGYRRTDIREEWLTKLKKALAAVLAERPKT